MKIAIIIPARYGSTRFPGKPLAKIAGQSMLSRVVARADEIKARYPEIDVLVATEDQRIADHCEKIGATCIITSDACPTGSDRVLEAANAISGNHDVLLSLQGDAPFTPVSALQAMIETFRNHPDSQVVTPVIRLRWAELDALRDAKKTTPFSGTTAVIDRNGKALWFSKNILPAIRKEEALRAVDEFAPVYQHIGLYAYRRDVLARFVDLPQGQYEQMEGLEQLRFLENDIPIQTVTIEVDEGLAQAGIDSPEDIARAESLLRKAGET